MRKEIENMKGNIFDKIRKASNKYIGYMIACDDIAKIVKEEVKRIFHNTYGNDVDIERWVRCMVSNEIQRHGDYSMIRNLCREIIKEEIADRLSIDISLKKKEG